MLGDVVVAFGMYFGGQPAAVLPHMVMMELEAQIAEVGV